jgi:hypothetical protein
MQTLGQKLSPIFKELADTVTENLGKKPNYEPSALKDVTQIFMDVVMDAMFNLQKRENITLEDSSAMSEQCGKELRAFVKKWCDIDTHNFYK